MLRSITGRGVGGWAGLLDFFHDVGLLMVKVREGESGSLVDMEKFENIDIAG